MADLPAWYCPRTGSFSSDTGNCAKLLKTESWHLLARLGEGGFDSSAAAGAFVALLTLSHGNPAGKPGGLFTATTAPGTMYGMDVADSRTATEKAARLPAADLTGIPRPSNCRTPMLVLD